MNDNVPGTPLASLVWKSDVGRVDLAFRTPTDPEVQARFLHDLIASATTKRWAIIKDMKK